MSSKSTSPKPRLSHPCFKTRLGLRALLCLLLGTAQFGGFSSSSFGALIVNTFSFSERIAPWNQTLEVPQVPSSQGKLIGLTLRLSIEAKTTTTLSQFGEDPEVFSVTHDLRVAFRLPNSEVIGPAKARIRPRSQSVIQGIPTKFRASATNEVTLTLGAEDPILAALTGNASTSVKVSAEAFSTVIGATEYSATHDILIGLSSVQFEMETETSQPLVLNSTLISPNQFDLSFPTLAQTDYIVQSTTAFAEWKQEIRIHGDGKVSHWLKTLAAGPAAEFFRVQAVAP